MASAIFFPWKRPFSMKISLVCIPATITPARKMPGRSLSSVSGLVRGRCECGFQTNAQRSHKIQIRPVSDHRENKIVF